MKQLKTLKEESTKHNRNSKIPTRQTVYNSSLHTTRDSKKPFINNNTTNKFIQLSNKILTKANDLINNNDKILDINKSYDEAEEEVREGNNSSNKKGDLFLTDLDFIKQRKEAGEDEKISMLEESTKRESSNFKAEFSNFKSMLDEIENAKRQIQSEYDDLNYLIKYVKDTKKTVKRHMSGVKQVINKVGANKFLKPIGSLEDSIEEKPKKDTVFDKNRQISKITHKLYGITNNVIGYHKNLSHNMEKIEYQNKKNNNIIKYNIH